MKGIKRIVSYVILVAVVVGCLCASASASTKTPRGHCTDVQCGGFTDYVCRDKVVRSETGTHKYGFLWQETCAVNYEYCYADLKCFGCGRVYESQVGPHDCYERHYNCGTGLYHVCPCGIWPGN